MVFYHIYIYIYIYIHTIYIVYIFSIVVTSTITTTATNTTIRFTDHEEAVTWKHKLQEWKDWNNDFGRF